MKRITVVLVMIALWAQLPCAAAQRRLSDGLRALGPQEQETIRRTLEFSSGTGTKTLEIEGIQCSIHVTGYDGRNVEMVATKSIRGSSPDRIQAGKDEVKLDISDKSDTIRIHVDYPWDRNRPNRSNSRSWNDPGYDVEFEFEVRVPRQAHLRLQSISGDVIVEDVAGDFDVDLISGAIEMRKVSGSGNVKTISGAMKVVFAESPRNSSSFSSINGDIEVTLPRNASADLRFKSFNGGVYTDFPTDALSSTPGTTSRRDGRFVFNTGFEGARIGKGGPTMKFDGFNGDVRILQAK